MDKYIYRGKLVRVVDGDTIDAMIDVGFDIWIKKRIRFSGMDAWESRTRDLEVKKKGLAAKARLKGLLNGVSSKPLYAPSLNNTSGFCGPSSLTSKAHSLIETSTFSGAPTWLLRWAK